MTIQNKLGKGIKHYFYGFIPTGGRIKALVDGLQYAAMSLEQEQDITVRGQTMPSKATLDNKINMIRKDIILR